jgi:hypothetical protein
MNAKQFAIIATIVCSCFSAAGAARAQSAAKPDLIADALNAFDQICLKRFPDSAAISDFVARNRLQPVSEAEMRGMLGTDPGFGWHLDRPPGPYTLTIELPPYHTCAIRKRFPNQPNVRARLGALLQSWTSAQRGARLKSEPTQSANVGGIDSRVDVFQVAMPGIREAEGMMAIVTPVRGGGSELRLARTLGNR